ncbi:MAG: DUF3124 domain-containing protein [Alphaproteobacteria bacterium]|nr:DUF3124 domain-containing protein [Alphaproteobacteria bacterium]
MLAFARRVIVSICCFVLTGGVSLAADMPPATQGQTVYVPVYSEVLYGNSDSSGKPDRWSLSATLSIRNTDPANALTVRSIRYYDTDGKLIREYAAGNKISPFGTLETFVEHKDKSGGSGANFLVVWDADKPINAPIIETVHTYFFGTRSVIFTSPGQALHVDGR